MPVYTHIWKSPVGEMIFGDYGGSLVLADWNHRELRGRIDKKLQDALHTHFEEKNTETIQLAISQLQEYFKGERKEFDIKYKLIGTKFQVAVWKLLHHIPYGKVISYKDLATTMGDVNRVRAVASANGSNCLSIIVPCHRVIGANGKLTGYAGGIKAKEKLLTLESAAFQNQTSLF